jgi:uncharacterized membrane protein YhhN
VITTAVGIAIALSLVAALADWWGVGNDRDRVVHVAKPAVMVALIAAVALMPDLPLGLRVCVLIAQVCGLIGDVLLMYDRFIPGAAAFLVGHFAYIAAWLQYWRSWAWTVTGVVIFLVILAMVGRKVLAGAALRGRTLGRIVGVYQLVLGAMVVTAFGTGDWLLAASAALFGLSDALLGWGRFVVDRTSVRLWVHITYHLAQIGIVASLPLLVRAA